MLNTSTERADPTCRAQHDGSLLRCPQTPADPFAVARAPRSVSSP